jgi:single-strand DNA-binding protein
MLPTISGEFGIVQEPDVRFTESGDMWMKLRGKATDRKRDADGNWVDGDICFMDILVSRKLAQYAAESVTKGSTITVTGALQYREWEDNEGRKQKSYAIRAESLGLTPRFGAVRGVDTPLPNNRAMPEQPEEAPF